MVLEVNRRGLIVTPSRRANDLLEELISQVEWPVLLGPSVRLLLQEIEVATPHCLLFWLDETDDIEHALQLITRLRDRGSRPYRVAIAHGLQADAEPAIRAAGVHSVLRTNGNIASLFQNALLPLLNLQTRSSDAEVDAVRSAEPLIRGPTSARASPAKTRPP